MAFLATIRRITERVQPWPDRLSRVGFLTKALVYLAVGGLAFLAAAGRGGKATDPSGALTEAASTRVGRIVVGVVALGLITHALFRVLLSLVGEPYGNHTPIRRLSRRIANGCVALGYFALGATAASLSIGWKSSAHTNDDAATQHWSSRLLHAPYGRPLLVAVAVAITIAAAVQLVRVAWPGQSDRRLRIEDMSPREHMVVSLVGRLAFLSRTIILAIIAYYLWHAAVDRAAREARGPGGALRAAWAYPHGDVLLAMMASGLVAVGAFALIEARWRRLFRR